MQSKNYVTCYINTKIHQHIKKNVSKTINKKCNTISLKKPKLKLLQVSDGL